jgi:hypothetical protein
MGYDTDVCSLSRGQNFCRVEEESRGLDPRILGTGRSVGVLKRPRSWLAETWGWRHSYQLSAEHKGNF